MKREDGLPTVSVVIPAFNEEKYIASALESLEEQDYPTDRYEVIVVDNGSTDATATVAQDFDVRLVRRPNESIGGVRNAGIEVAEGEVIAFLDADCVAPPGWLEEAVDVLVDRSVGAVGGSCTVPETGSWVERARWTHPPSSQRNVKALASSSLIARRDVLEQVGGFNDELGAAEDDDLSTRVREAGYCLILAPGCNVVHLGYPDSLAGIFRRQLWHGRSQLQVAAGPDRLLLLTHLFVIVCLLIPTVTVVTGTAGLALVGLLVMTGIGLAFVAALTRRPRSVIHQFQLSLIFVFFLAGRSLGLLLSYSDLLRSQFRS